MQEQAPPGVPPARPEDLHINCEPGSTPPNVPPYRLSPVETQELQRQLTKLLELGYIRPSHSNYAAPCLFVPTEAREGTKGVPSGMLLTAYVPAQTPKGLWRETCSARKQHENKAVNVANPLSLNILCYSQPNGSSFDQLFLTYFEFSFQGLSKALWLWLLCMLRIFAICRKWPIRLRLLRFAPDGTPIKRSYGRSLCDDGVQGHESSMTH